MPLRMSMANITTHVLSSGDREKMKISHTTNDPRPFFRKKTTQLPTHLSHKKKTCHFYHLDGHMGLGRAREPHQNNPYNSKNLESRRGIVHICLLG